jgi:hypothetical protein
LENTEGICKENNERVSFWVLLEVCEACRY